MNFDTPISDVIKADEVADALAFVVQEVDRDSADVVLDALGIDALESVAKAVGVKFEHYKTQTLYLQTEIMKRLENR